ncbi:MAG: hypothetical protein ACI9NC_000418, partial [Verrucomicrobiales bacterium]
MDTVRQRQPPCVPTNAWKVPVGVAAWHHRSDNFDAANPTGTSHLAAT